MKTLNGSELAGFIKERQAKQIRGLRQAEGIFPKLAIVRCDQNPVIDTYVRIKKNYGEDILVEVVEYQESMATVDSRLQVLNNDTTVHGVILQLPIEDPSRTDELVALISPTKDVDGLRGDSSYDSATAVAINWLLAGYNVSLAGKKVAIVGNGRLVGAPLAKMWRNSGYDVAIFDKNDGHDLRQELPGYEVVVTATGVPGLITSDMVATGAVVVDAGTASENGVIKGDVASGVRERHDLTLTPERGGVGPLTVAALFDNVIRAARGTVTKD